MRINRELLCQHGPCETRHLDSGDVDIIAEWLAKRYTRAAFPDAFADRLGPDRKKIDKALKKSGELLTGIFLALSSWEELPAEQAYEVMLRITAKREDLADIQLERNLAALVVRLKDAMSRDGVSMTSAVTAESPAAIPFRAGDAGLPGQLRDVGEQPSQTLP